VGECYIDDGRQAADISEYSQCHGVWTCKATRECVAVVKPSSEW